MPPWLLVTPASRGIGLHIARRLLRCSKLPLVATTRGDLDKTREDILSSGGDGSSGSKGSLEERLHVLKLDFTDEQTIADAASQCSSLLSSANSETKSSKTSTPSHLHTAFVLPGMLTPEKSPSQLELATITQTFHLNTIAPLLMLKHFSPFLPRKNANLPLQPSTVGDCINTHRAVWAAMSARVGSIADNRLGGWYSYRASKAALNQAVKTFDNYLVPKSGGNAIAVALHPGTVKTELSREFWDNVRPEKLFEAEYAAERLVEVVRGLEEGQRGRIWDWAGKEISP